MPGYAKDAKTVCFFRTDKKYMTFGFTKELNLTREEGRPRAAGSRYRFVISLSMQRQTLSAAGRQ
ncbi:MAG: hypothetical protein ACRD3T_09325 [Terriglobia bacterium]